MAFVTVTETEVLLLPTPLPKTCPRFSDANGDITFKSCDGVLFKIYSKYLAATSGSLPIPSALTMTPSEVVQLSEPYETLTLLFQFIHPRSEADNFWQPSIIGMKPERLFPLAEAAEKYHVFGLMNLCITHFHQLIKEHPIEILNHAHRHGYRDLADQVAVGTISQPLEKVAKGLIHPGLLHVWLLYSLHWRNLAMEVLAHFDKPDSRDCSNITQAKNKFLNAVLQNLWGADYDPINGVMPCTSRDAFSLHCSCSTTLKQVKDLITSGAAKIPKFSEISIVKSS